MKFISKLLTQSPKHPKFYTFDLISSKGLKKKDSYALSPTGTAHNLEELIDRMKAADKILYIKFGPDLEKLPSLLKYLKTPVTLITSDGDGSIPLSLGTNKALSILEHPSISKWFTQNYDGTLKHPKLLPYPIGPDLHSPQWMIGGHPINKVRYMLSLRNNDSKKLNKILCDTFITRNRHPDRKEFCEKLYNAKHVKLLRFHRGVKSIFKLYSKYRFVVSPHGGGLDCHRTWEVLLLGSIPIVKTSSLDPLYKNLPVVIVEDWDECKDLSNLDQWWKKLKEKTALDHVTKELSYKKFLGKE